MSTKRFMRHELKLLRFLKKQIREEHIVPSYREMRRYLKLQSTSGIAPILDSLEAKGYIKRYAGRSRCIVLLENDNNEAQRRTVPVPLLSLGPASFGQDTLDGFDPEASITLTTDLVADDPGLYALRVSGDSLIDAHINDGDVVVLRRQEEARDGDLVQAWLVSEESATVKRFYQEHGLVLLQPENAAMKPRLFSPEDVRVQGKVVMVLRSLERPLAA